MKCPYCKENIPDGSTFCEKCGQELNSPNSDIQNTTDYWKEYHDAVREDIQSTHDKIKIQEKKNKQKRIMQIVAIILVACVSLWYVYSGIIVPGQKYSNAVEMMQAKNFADAFTLFSELGTYKDASTQAIDCRYNIAMEFIQEKDYTQAIAILSELGNHKDSADQITLCYYNMAVEEYEQGKYEKAFHEFYEFGDYADSMNYRNLCKLAIINNSGVGDIVYWGNYNENPIEWTVLESDGNSMKLISTCYLFEKEFNGDYRQIGGKAQWQYACWSTSSLRRWLNNDFIQDAFSADEQSMLLSNTITTDEYDLDRYVYLMLYINDIKVTTTTEDKVYIPSMHDVERYGLTSVDLLGTNESIRGWLRDRGNGVSHTCSLIDNEFENYSSQYAFGIRPIITIDVSNVQ